MYLKTSFFSHKVIRFQPSCCTEILLAEKTIVYLLVTDPFRFAREEELYGETYICYPLDKSKDILPIQYVLSLKILAEVICMCIYALLWAVIKIKLLH